VAVLVLTVGVACGGSEGDPGGEKGAYIDKVDPACERAIQEANRIGSATDTASLEKSNINWRVLWDTAKSSPIPGEDYDLGARFLAGLNNLSLAAEAAYQASIINDQAIVQKSLSGLATSRDTTADAAKDYGFKECDKLGE
jgi:hypothetical protein